MVSGKQKILVGLLIAQILVAIAIFLNAIDSKVLRGWLWLNLLAIALTLLISVGLKVRQKSRAQYRRTRHDFKNRNTEQQYYNPQVTLDGTMVKSAGERLIANYFHEHNIQYEYEKPARDLANRRIISRPDFYLPDYGIYVEYWGMVNTKEHQKRQEYIKGMEWKMARYRENGLKFISVYPEDLGKLDSIFKTKLRLKY